eukprot:1177082-Prorocentrum_minimum.AAC.6
MLDPVKFMKWNSNGGYVEGQAVGGSRRRRRHSSSVDSLSRTRPRHTLVQEMNRMAILGA